MKAMKSTIQKGQLFVVSAPSGTGKTTITERLQEMGAAKISVSYTTRPPREGEVDGKNYFFVNRKDFIAMRKDGKFLESAEVYGNLYGTSKDWVMQQLKNVGNIILELDVKGARQVKKLFPQAILLFIRPPSLRTLGARLRKRGKDSPKVIALRLSKAKAEIRCRKSYAHTVINENLDNAVTEVHCIIRDQKQHQKTVPATSPLATPRQSQQQH